MPMTDRLRAYAGSPAGSKVVPGVSAALLVVGAVLVILSFSGGGDPETVATETVAPGPPATEQLTEAMVVAKDSLIAGRGKKNSYKRFNAESATAAADRFVWTDGGPAAEGEISIRKTKRTGIVLVTAEGETVYCLADDNADDKVMKGSGPGIDPQRPEDCTGGW